MKGQKWPPQKAESGLGFKRLFSIGSSFKVGGPHEWKKMSYLCTAVGWIYTVVNYSAMFRYIWYFAIGQFFAEANFDLIVQLEFVVVFFKIRNRNRRFWLSTPNYSFPIWPWTCSNISYPTRDQFIGRVFFVLDFRKIGGEFEPSLPTVFFLWSYSRVNVRIIVFLRVIYFQYTCQLYVTYFIYTSTLLLNHFIRRILGSPEVLRSVFSSGPKKKIRFGYGNPGNVRVQPPTRRWSYTIR